MDLGDVVVREGLDSRHEVEVAGHLIVGFDVAFREVENILIGRLSEVVNIKFAVVAVFYGLEVVDLVNEVLVTFGGYDLSHQKYIISLPFVLLSKSIEYELLSILLILSPKISFLIIQTQNEVS